MSTINTALSNAWQGFFYSLAGSGAITGKQARIAAGLIDKAANTSNGEVLAAASTLTAEDSGKTFYMNLDAGFVTTLPAPALGLNYKFVVKDAPSAGAYDIATNGGANVLQINHLIAGAASAVANQDTVSFAQTNSGVGDTIEMQSDGTNWYVQTRGVAASSITNAAT